MNSARQTRTVSESLAAKRWAAWLALVWERLWPLILPLLCVFATFLTISWLGLWPLMGDVTRWLSLAVLMLAACASLLPLGAFKRPSKTEVDARIEQSSRLEHRPITAQTDSLTTAQKDPFAAALWREHQMRMRQGLSGLSSGKPVPQIAQRDPYAMRAVVGLVLFIAAVAGFGEWGTRVGDAFRSHTSAQLVATSRIDAWVTPPAYTNRPPIYLDLAKSGGQPLQARVPEGSVFVVRALNVDAPKFTRMEGENERTLFPQEEDAATFETVLGAQPHPYTLSDGGTVLARFVFDIVPDHAPTIGFVDAPSASIRGALEMSYSVVDDYGVAGAEARLRSLDVASVEAKPLVEAPQMRLPLPRRNAKEGTARLSRDLTSHPWAGGTVAMRLRATDAAGQVGESEEVSFTLPERVFTDPLAKAIVFERRRLAVDMANRASVAEMLAVITDNRPEEFIPNRTHYTALRVAYRMIDRGREVELLREALDLLWQTALAIEDGDLSDAERRLREAQDKLAEALENGASEAEIARLMQELREAMADFMREFAQRQQENTQQAVQAPNAQQLNSGDLDQMMQRIEDLAKSGSRDAARELLREMQRMMNNLQMAQPNQQRQQDPMSQQLNKLSDMMREQQRLMDETFQMQRQQQQQGEQQPGQQNGQRPMTAEELAEAMEQLQRQQGGLQRQMDELQQSLRELGQEPGEQLGEAGEAMGNAESELGEGQMGSATGEQGRALQAMREGAQQIMRNMQQQAGERGRQGERGQHGEQNQGERDPLGRRVGNTGPRMGDDVKVPGEIDAQRAREILDAIRKRLEDATRPRLELDYLDRLLPN